MTVTIVKSRAVTGGVDTHAGTHMAAALDPVGGLLGVEELPASPTGYARLLAWLGERSTVRCSSSCWVSAGPASGSQPESRIA